MDSMIGYKSERYKNIGFVAAKLDDLVNYIPSRLSAIFMITASFIMPSYSGRDAFLVWKRDKRKHASPNSAQTESVMAGALGVMLAGDATYFGKVHKKETIGNMKKRIDKEDIRRANNLLYGTCFLAYLSFVLIKQLTNKNR